MYFFFLVRKLVVFDNYVTNEFGYKMCTTIKLTWLGFELARLDDKCNDM